MEPLKIKVYTDNAYTHTNRPLGPGPNKVWKVGIQSHETGGPIGTMTIQRDSIGTETFNVVGTEFDTTDANSGIGNELWLLNGEYIKSWSKLHQVKIYEYAGYSQNISSVSQVTGEFDYRININQYTDYPEGGYNPNIYIGFGVTGPCWGPDCPPELPSYQGATTDSEYSSMSLPSDLSINFIGLNATEYPIPIDVPGSLYEVYTSHQMLSIPWIDYAPIEALEEWDFSYCYGGTGGYIFPNISSQNSCANSGLLWHSGSNDFRIEYPDGTTGGITSKEFTLRLPSVVNLSTSSTSSILFHKKNSKRDLKIKARRSISKQGLSIKRPKFKP